MYTIAHIIKSKNISTSIFLEINDLMINYRLVINLQWIYKVQLHL